MVAKPVSNDSKREQVRFESSSRTTLLRSNRNQLISTTISRPC